MAGHEHIVVCGYPRAGTTLLYNMMRSTIKGYKFYDNEIKAEMTHRKEPNVSKITKRPTDISDSKNLAKQIPNVKFIVCIRDPRSVLVSEHGHAPGQFKIGWDSALKTNRKKGVVGKAPGLLERDRKVREVPSPFFVYYENLVTNPLKVQQELKDYFGFEYADHFENFHKYNIPETLSVQLNGIREVSSDRIKSWKNYPERIKQQFEECPELFEIVRYWGYESDDLWIQDLYEG